MMVFRSDYIFIAIICVEVLLCGINNVLCHLDSADTAIVEVVSIPLSEQIETDFSENSTFVQIKGKFARVGAVKNVQGDLREVELSDGCEDLDDGANDSHSEEPWIGVLKIPATEYLNSYGSRSCSVLDRVRQAMLIGASALLIITVTAVNYKMARKQLDVTQLFTRPVVFISGPNASKVIHSLQRDKTRKLRASISYNSTFYEMEKLSTLTLWATCGRRVGWEGVVCLGNPDRRPEAESTSFWISSVFYASILFFILVLKSRLSCWLERYWSSKEEESLQHLAAMAMRQLKTRIWRRGRKRWKKCETGEGSRKCGETEHRELCAVCLDEYFHKQILRVLPCGHEFHSSCVDKWLLAKRTCPLCKGNIIERLHRTKVISDQPQCLVI